MTSLGRRAHLAVRVLIYIGRRQRDNERAQGASGRNVGRRCRGWAQTGISPSRVCEKLRTGLPDPDSDVLVLPARTSLIVAMHARAYLVCQGSDRLRADAFTRRSGLRAVARSLLCECDHTAEAPIRGKISAKHSRSRDADCSRRDCMRDRARSLNVCRGAVREGRSCSGIITCRAASA